MTAPRSIAPNDASGAVGARAQQSVSAGACTPAEEFNPGQLETTALKARLFVAALAYPQRLLSLARWLTPVLRISGLRWAIVLRYDEVRETLSQDKSFPVPWGWKMVEVTGGEDAGGKNFVLGMPHDDDYRDSYKQIANAFPLDEVWSCIGKPSGERSREILASKQENFDAIENLIAAVPTRMCRDYYGLAIDDEVDFAKRALAVSSYLFGPDFERPVREKPPEVKLAHAAASGMRNVIRQSIELAHQDRGKGVVLPRLIGMQRKQKANEKRGKGPVRLTDDVIHAQLFGMVMGFIPTNTLAGGNILETLLLRPDFMERCRAAACADDDDLLWRCLREALRFRHINPGPWRVCRWGYTFFAGSDDEIRIEPGYTVLASTQSAMFDPRRIERPHEFDPHRRDEDYMVFGVGQHWCVGAYIAIAQITHTFKPLLKLSLLKPHGSRRPKMHRFGAFPLHLRVDFAP